MKKSTKIVLGVLLVIVLAIVLFLGFLGYIPGLSGLLGAHKPRDLGVTYTKADFNAARGKSQVEYAALPSSTPAESSIVRSGSRPVTTSWNSAEMTSLLNDRPWKYWPIKSVQLKINNDGTAEMSGIVMKDKLGGYAAAIGVPSKVADRAVSLLPSNAAFYVKAKTSLTNNQVSDFDIQSVQLGRMSIPTNLLLSEARLVQSALAADTITSELSKYSGKKAAIVNFINGRLGKITGFFAKRAYFSEGKLNFDGTLSETEAMVP
jgi:hypothetical protein